MYIELPKKGSLRPISKYERPAEQPEESDFLVTYL